MLLLSFRRLLPPILLGPVLMALVVPTIATPVPQSPSPSPSSNTDTVESLSLPKSAVYFVASQDGKPLHDDYFVKTSWTKQRCAGMDVGIQIGNNQQGHYATKVSTGQTIIGVGDSTRWGVRIGTLSVRSVQDVNDMWRLQIIPEEFTSQLAFLRKTEEEIKKLGWEQSQLEKDNWKFLVEKVKQLKM
ncbi:hypothetical protein EV360DRAFT_71525 [Lentinula raphanica]|nr:hypothetical protein EV360DRAFT_71525 [Lentinula raphanica]